MAEHPETADRYLDVGIRYLPIAAASALRDVMVVLAPENRRISVSKMSDLEPGSLKSADIVYIGYLSGMGMFQDLTFAGSRFTVGESYDEIIDKTTKRTARNRFSDSEGFEYHSGTRKVPARDLNRNAV